MANKIKLKRGSGRQKKGNQLAGRAGVSQPGLFQQALALHQGGHLSEAEALYRQILQAEPDHPVALHYLGILAHQVGKNEISLELMRRAVALKPDFVEAHYFLGNLLQAQAKFDEAAASYRQVLTWKPDSAEAHNNLGIVLHELGRLDEAAVNFHRAITLMPDYVEAYNNLGILYNEQGKLKEAIASFRQAVNLKPDYAEAHNNLGNAFKEQGKLEEAIARYRQALSLKPDYAVAHYNLGIALNKQGKLEEAIASYRQALSLIPAYADAHNNLGNALKEQGKEEEAIASYRQALTLKPDYVEAFNNLGIVLKDQGLLEEAIICYRRALALKQDFADVHNNLGIALRDQGKLDEATDSYRRALTLKPEFAEVHNNLGIALRDQGKLEEAIACLRQALVLKPDFVTAHSNLLFCLNYLPDLAISQYMDEARNYGRQAAAKVRARFTAWNCSTRPVRLRIGLVSDDLRNHPVGYFLENMLANIDLNRIDLIAYPINRGGDALTARIRSHFVAWKPLTGLDDAAAARMIHDDGVHILLDLSGHTRCNRLPVFAWKPAPVQASWLGYFASTGLAEMDYLIADPVAISESCREHFTEKVWYLPETRLCFSPPTTGEELPSTPLPALDNGYITFGSFQNMAKLNDTVLAVWGKIFQLLPRAKLRLQNHLLDSPSIREQLQRRLALVGIAPERILFEKPVPRLDYLAAHACIDMILDTFPYPGGTTTCEALWMGVPTLTLAGHAMLGRQGASMLACTGLTDWIAVDEEDYVAKAVTHAAELEKLARLRSGLRRQVSVSPLFDGPRFARNFEAALWGMWQARSQETRDKSQN